VSSVINIQNLHHSYGTKQIYAGLNLKIEAGSVFGLLGKNGVGKSTLINILMGYLRPNSGQCLVFGERSHNLSPETRSRIALLYEGFTSYDAMNIIQIEHFFATFYPRWQSKVFYELIEFMDVRMEQKLSSLSFGQKSQVVLGLLFAQNADLLILDDYSMGLDAGYRRLFVDYLKDYLQGTNKTVLMTSHVMNDLEHLVDQIAIVDRSTDVYLDSMDHFCSQFRCFESLQEPPASDLIRRCEKNQNRFQLYSLAEQKTLEQKFNLNIIEKPLTFEEKFLGFVGKY